LKSWSLLFVLLLFLVIWVLFLLPREVDNTTSVASDSSETPLTNYIMNLELQREECYSDILILGTLNIQQLERLKFMLEIYLEELTNVKRVVQFEEKQDWRLNQSIELDMKLIEKVILAIETKDEEYLRDSMQIYQQLIKLQQMLKKEIENSNF
jgi:tRNA threonylcarbamoyladenosine modification (KEOPS) complex  Pcc1 subunit